MSFNWQLIDELRRHNVDFDFRELIFGNVLLIIGGWSLGFGSGRIDVAGFAIAFSGGVMLFAGILMNIRSGSAIAKALNNASRSATREVVYIPDKTLGSEEHKSSRYNSLQSKVVTLQRDVKYLAQYLKRVRM